MLSLSLPSVLSFSDFLKQSAAIAAKTNYQHLSHIAIGNEAGDADSIISALTFPYVLATTTSNTSTNTENTITPVLSIPRQDLQTQRPETSLLLQLAGLNQDFLQSHLVDVNDILPSTPDQDACATTKTTTLVTLLDHNRLSDKFHMETTTRTTSTSWKVVEILDHHLDLQSHTDTCANNTTTSGQRRNIAFDGTTSKALVASTCTLVAERWFQHVQRQGHEPSSSSLLSPQVALLLLGTILLDSVNMSPTAGKGTTRDFDAIQLLLNGTSWSEVATTAQSILTSTTTTSTNQQENSNVADVTETSTTRATIRPDTTKLFDVLQNAKFDVNFWRGLSVRDALRLDYKAFTAASSKTIVLGFASVLLSWADFSQKTRLWTQLRQYLEDANDVKMDVLVVMFTYSHMNDDKKNNNNNTLQRELFLCAKKNNKDGEACIFDRLVKHLIQEDKGTDPNLLHLVHQQLPSPPDEDLTVRLFQQGNSKASRKQVAPILLQLLEELPTQQDLES